MVKYNKQFEYISFGFGKLKRAFIIIFWHFIDKAIIWLNEKIIGRLTDNENNC